MASSATIDSQQPLPHSPFAALRLGRSSQSIHARLLRFWDSSNFSNPGEFKGITLLFLDEKDSMINGIIPAEQANHYRRSLQEGDIYRVAHFEVGICPHMYKSTEHTFLIRFLEETTIDPIINNCPHISQQKFMVRNYEQLQILANTNLELPDVVGQIQMVKGYDLKNAEVISPLLIRLRIAPNIEVDVSLWDTAAATFKAVLNSGEKAYTVMVVTSVAPEKIGDKLYLSSTPATKCFFSPTLQAITDFTMSLRGAVTNFDDNTENATWPLSSIGDLSYFLSNPTDQEPYFVCKARIVDVLGQHGWYYVCCTQCSKEIVWYQCGNTNDTGVVRYRVELLVDDGNNYATFVVFNKEMLEMTNQHAATLFLNEVNVGLDDKLPQCVSGLEGQTFVFHIRVKPCNSTQNYSPFTVSAISHNIDTKDFNIKESPCVDLRCDEPSTPPPANNTLTAEVEEGERSQGRTHGQRNGVTCPHLNFTFPLVICMKYESAPI
ncbi:uncharacterized protein LOC106381729 [Brassica napus]|uniref:uncharacterized protein LOC106381729 n=1 Tax=Brassica napus TaxID=3708 RepID=UPI000BBF170B|nr:uncharacterized protein LOC106381729 [Brassica napus]